MKNQRHRSREFVIQGLYEWLMTQESAAFIEQTLRENEQFVVADADFVTHALRGIIADAPALGSAISPHLSRDFDLVNPVERAVLLLATFEMKQSPETPLRVIINEAIELTKTFGGADGHKFVNGVLDQVALALRPLERPAP